MSSGKIRVGIIGAGGWARYGHVPALRTLDSFEIVEYELGQYYTMDRIC